MELWGRSDYRRLDDGRGTATCTPAWGGDLFGVRLGADVRPQQQAQWLAGLTVGWSTGAFDWSNTGDCAARSGVYGVEMLSVHPYVGGYAGGRVGLWATAGYGFGGITLTEDDADAQEQASDSTLLTATAGLDLPLLNTSELIAGGTTTVQARGEATVSHFEVAGDGLLRPQTLDAQRYRITLASAHEQVVGGGRLAPSLEIGVRHDEGAGASGTGAAGSVGLRYGYPPAGLTLAGQGHGFLRFDSDYREWGAELALGFDPGAPRQGLAVEASTQYGSQQGRSGQVFESPVDGQTAAVSEPEGRLAVDVGYGLPAFDGAGTITPYSGLQLAEAEQRYQLGMRLEVGSALSLTLGGERRQPRMGEPQHEVSLNGTLRY